MQYFYDLNEGEQLSRPGRKSRRVIGKDVMMVCVEREAGTRVDHSHNSEQIFYLVKGKASFNVAGETREIQGGEAVHIPSGLPHDFKALTPITYISVYSPPRDAG